MVGEGNAEGLNLNGPLAASCMTWGSGLESLRVFFFFLRGNGSVSSQELDPARRLGLGPGR